MTVKQVGRTYNSITVNVSGILTGDRQTYIGVHKRIDGSGGWYKLSEAKEYGYISDYDTVDVDDGTGGNNGDIIIEIPDKYVNISKVWAVEVQWLVDGAVNAWVRIPIFLQFVYDNATTKYTGEPIDITHNDMAQINLFGMQIKTEIMNTTAYYYSQETIEAYKEIYANFLLLPSSNIEEAARDAYSNGYLENYLLVYGETYSINNNVYSGAPFRAGYFNSIKKAINNFNLSITV